MRVREHTDRPKRRRSNLRSVPGLGLNERPQRLKTIRLEFINNLGLVTRQRIMSISFARIVLPSILLRELRFGQRLLTFVG